MANFADIGLSQPAASTITMKVGTVTLTRNSTTVHQEVLHIGDPETVTAAGIARVSTGPAPTTEAGLIVRGVVYQSSGADLRATMYQSTAADLNVTVAGYSTIAAVSSVAGRVTTMPLSTVWASSAGFHFDSSGAMQVNVVAGTISASTTVQVSSVAGRVQTAPSDTNWLSSAGAHFNSSGALMVDIGAVPGVDYTHGTTLTASTVAGPAIILRASSTTPAAVSTSDVFVVGWATLQGAAVNTLVTSSGTSVMDSTLNAINVNVLAQTTGAFAISSIAGQTRVAPVSTLWASSAGFHFDSSGALQVTGGTSSTQVTVSQLLDSSGGSVTAADSANNAIRVNVVAGAAAGSTIVTVSALPLISSAVVAGGSSALTVRNVWSSTNTDQPVSARAFQSTASDLNMTARLQDGTGNALESSTSAASSGARGLIVRPVVSGSTTFAVSTAFNNSTALTIASSQATNKAFVYAISIMSTSAGVVAGGFYSGGTLLWPFAMSSGFGGFNLAVSPPAYLFSGSTGSSLTVNTSGSTIAGGVNVGVAYWVST